jgi:D-lyxose ketol-isomerase
MFNVCFIAHARDADLLKHRSIIETDTYMLHSVVVRNQKEAVEVITELVMEKGVQSVLLCPGFTHQNVAEITEVVMGKAGVAVARADGPSNIISKKARTGR